MNATLLNREIKCGKPNHKKQITIVINTCMKNYVEARLKTCEHPDQSVVDKFNGTYINAILTAKSMNNLKDKIFDMLEIEKTGNRNDHVGFWMDVMRIDGITIRKLQTTDPVVKPVIDPVVEPVVDPIVDIKQTIIAALNDKKPFVKCSEPGCESKTRRTCSSCNNCSACKKHSVCLPCKDMEAWKKQELAANAEMQTNRERARNAYRKKVGIPLDAPLIQRGGAHNVKYHTEEEKIERKIMDREYQREYQKKYREKKMQEKAIMMEICEEINKNLKSPVYNMAFFLESLKNKKQGKSYSDVE